MLHLCRVNRIVLVLVSMCLYSMFACRRVIVVSRVWVHVCLCACAVRKSSSPMSDRSGVRACVRASAR